MLRAAAAERVVHLDDTALLLKRAAKALAIAVRELRRVGATETAALIEAARQEVARTNESAG